MIVEIHNNLCKEIKDPKILQLVISMAGHYVCIINVYV